MRSATLVFLVGVSSCGADPPARLVGEMHVHQFAGGAHVEARFVATPVPAATAGSDSLAAPPSPARTVGACALLLDAGDDGPVAMGAPDVDGGDLHIAGGAIVPAVDLTFDPSSATYRPTAALPSATRVFAGGETLAYAGRGSARVPPFSGALVTPSPIEVRAPTTLAIGDGDLTVRWSGAPGGSVSVSLVASRTDGAFATVQCVVDDASGVAVLPQTLLEALPPRPRDLQLEVSRDRFGRAPIAGRDEGVILHAAEIATMRAHEE